jgi:hypothetical protein
VLVAARARVEAVGELAAILGSMFR